jgi:hypothetical protein
MAITYRKSSKGVAEIETRAHRLPPRLRSALIIVDGRRTRDELDKLLPQQAEGALATLLEQGFIEVVGGPAAATPARPAAPATAPAPAPALAQPPESKPAARAPTVPFESRRGEAVRRLTDHVGPMGEALALRMERCRSADELRPLLGVAMQVIANTRGRQAAEEYGARFSDL